MRSIHFSHSQKKIQSSFQFIILCWTVLTLFFMIYWWSASSVYCFTWIHMRKILFKSNCPSCHDRNKHPLAFNTYLLDFDVIWIRFLLLQWGKMKSHSTWIDKWQNSKEWTTFSICIHRSRQSSLTISYLFNQFQYKLNALFVFHRSMKYLVGNFLETFVVSSKAPPSFEVCHSYGNRHAVCVMCIQILDTRYRIQICNNRNFPQVDRLLCNYVPRNQLSGKPSKQSSLFTIFPSKRLSLLSLTALDFKHWYSV